MSEVAGDRAVAYVEAAAVLLALPLSAERAAAVASVMRRIAFFAGHVNELELGNDVEIAGVFRP
jgi:hypothetical protein